jgi:phosphoglycolate phosphatase
MIASPAAVLFDLDGTLTDPKLGITRSIQHALRELGNTPPDCDELTWCIGPPLRPSLGQLLGSTDDGLLDRALVLYRERFSTVGLFENTLFPEIPAVLHALRAAGYRTYVATSKPHVFASRIVEHFGLAPLFDRVYGSELDGRRVDKGELIAYALAEEKLEPGRVVMVGDREHDMIGACCCGLPAIGVTWGYGAESELRAHGAHRLAHRPEEIPALVLD